MRLELAHVWLALTIAGFSDFVTFNFSAFSEGVLLYLFSVAPGYFVPATNFF